MICPQCNEWKPLERNGICASCNAAIRKAERMRTPVSSEPIAKVSPTLLLDDRYWLAVCHEAHQKITDDPKWAWENQYSFKRITDPIFRK